VRPVAEVTAFPETWAAVALHPAIHGGLLKA
jgi:AICAR transformylase/IMP cyclohydrolase PurH